MSGGGQKEQTTTQTTNTAPWSAQQPYLEKGFKEAENIYNQGPATMYGGSFTAPTDAATTASLNAIENRATTGSPMMGAANAESLKTLQGGYLGQDNPYMQGMIDRTAADVLPRLNAGFMNSGGPGGLQTRAASMGLADSANSMRYGNYNDERNRMTSAVANAPALASADYMDPSMLGTVGAAREGIAQKGIDENIARYDFAQNADSDALARYMQMVQGNYGGSTTGTSTAYLPQPNPWMQALGLISSAAGSAAGAYAKSDIRAKTDIERVGAMDDGTNIYRYRYKTGGPAMFGVMAQEVAETKPHAVAVMPDGELGVNYLAL